jgi:hypothetical protein
MPTHNQQDAEAWVPILSEALNSKNSEVCCSALSALLSLLDNCQNDTSDARFLFDDPTIQNGLFYCLGLNDVTIQGSVISPSSMASKVIAKFKRISDSLGYLVPLGLEARACTSSKASAVIPSLNSAFRMYPKTKKPLNQYTNDPDFERIMASLGL